MIVLETGRAVHATAIVVGTTGVLFTGASGAGKSSAALRTLGAAQRAGRHAALVADDGVLLEIVAGRVIGHCPEPIAGKAEIRGSGIFACDWRPSAVIGLVVAPGEAIGEGRLPVVGERCRVGALELPVLRLDYPSRIEPFDVLERFMALARGPDSARR